MSVDLISNFDMERHTELFALTRMRYLYVMNTVVVTKGHHFVVVRSRSLRNKQLRLPVQCQRNTANVANV